MTLVTPRIYGLLTSLCVPLAKLCLKKRAKKQPDYLLNWDERFARKPFPSPVKPRLWVHAVSVGETNAAAPLIEELVKRFGDIEVLLTCMTPTGRDAGLKLAKRFAGRVTQCYLPYDVPAYARRFLDETRPRLAVFMETEVWPNMLAEIHRRGIPVVLANARESEKSLKKALQFEAVMRPAFAAFDAVLAQSKADAVRFEALGAKNITVCGSLKFEVREDPGQTRLARDFKAKAGRPVVLIASTREGEEAMFAPLLRCFAGKATVLLVPRHPQRFNEVAQLLEAAGLDVVRRSACPSLEALDARHDVILGDSMGEMSFYCAAADVCLMGGSFGNTGCQNLIEPAAAGSPVILGPSTYNFAQIAADALRMGAAFAVKDAREGITRALELVDNAALRSLASQRALTFAKTYTGAVGKMADKAEELWKKSA